MADSAPRKLPVIAALIAQYAPVPCAQVCLPYTMNLAVLSDELPFRTRQDAYREPITAVVAKVWHRAGPLCLEQPDLGKRTRVTKQMELDAQTPTQPGTSANNGLAI